MGVYKFRGHACPMCNSGNTSIRTSNKITPAYQVLYYDCNNENCLTRFTANLTTGHVIHTLFEEKANPQPQENSPENQLAFNL
jgi:hypothetical protein